MKSHSAPSTLEEIAHEFLNMFAAIFGFLTNPEAWRDAYHDVRTKARHSVTEEVRPRVRRNGDDRAYIYKRPKSKESRGRYYKKDSKGSSRSDGRLKYYRKRSGESSQEGDKSRRRERDGRGSYRSSRKRGSRRNRGSSRD